MRRYANGVARGTLQYVNLCAPGSPAVDVLPPRTFGFPADIASRPDGARETVVECLATDIGASQ